MKRYGKAALVLLIVALGLVLTSCGPDFAESGKQIIEAKDALKMAAAGDVILVDAQPALSYNKEHVEGAVNIDRASIVVNAPYPNLVGEKAQIEKALGSRGIGNDSTVVIYDANKNMDSGRLWWTMVAYGHDPGKVMAVSGGLEALKAAGAAVTTAKPSVTKATYSASALDESMMATLKEVRDQVNNPDGGTLIVDTRSLEEFNEGTIPGSILLNFEGNNFSDGTYKPVQQIRIRYLEAEIDPAKTVIMYCKTSIRGAQTYLALYNAGYRNLKLYDGAWVEWSSKPSLPVQIPETAELPVLNSQDGS